MTLGLLPGAPRHGWSKLGKNLLALNKQMKYCSFSLSSVASSAGGFVPVPSVWGGLRSGAWLFADGVVLSISSSELSKEASGTRGAFVLVSPMALSNNEGQRLTFPGRCLALFPLVFIGSWLVTCMSPVWTG